MKTLNTEQQQELQSFIQGVAESGVLPLGLQAQANYWSIELKPKRKKKVNKLVEEAISSAQNLTDTPVISVDTTEPVV